MKKKNQILDLEDNIKDQLMKIILNFDPEDFESESDESNDPEIKLLITLLIHQIT